MIKALLQILCNLHECGHNLRQFGVKSFQLKTANVTQITFGLITLHLHKFTHLHIYTFTQITFTSKISIVKFGLDLFLRRRTQQF